MVITMYTRLTNIAIFQTWR